MEDQGFGLEHTYGLNDKSLGICLIGRDKFTRNQFDSLEMILKI